MIITTTETIEGKKIIRTLGMARGNTIRARHIGRDILALLHNIVGGEIPTTPSSWPSRANNHSTAWSRTPSDSGPTPSSAFASPPQC